ncbi:hypothetical protein [Sphingomonas sp.]|uniref:hypothetical protein n=1 Tax=Sphingomonas sp. TaxID=28214 RepID=UPI0017B63156|nr:hypothetical protein [Sphingomonas sp.]MBA3512067.1 hypothetical protein [Sphingomonas sp.]
MNFLQIFDWHQFKLLVEHSTGISMDALHILVGVLIQLLVAVLFKSSVARWRPLLAVLALVLINEVNDFLVDVWPDPGMQLGEALKDIVLTMLIPSLIFVLARRRPELLGQDSNWRPSGSKDSS